MTCVVSAAIVWQSMYLKLTGRSFANGGSVSPNMAASCVACLSSLMERQLGACDETLPTPRPDAPPNSGSNTGVSTQIWALTQENDVGLQTFGNKR